MNELRFERKSIMSLDHGWANTHVMLNSLFEGRKCQHEFSPYNHICGKCGSTAEEVHRRIYDGVYDEFEDTYDQNNKLIHRRRIKK